MTPPQVFVDLWPQIQNLYPDMKFKLITFENTLENAREILANLGQNIDVVAGIFDETMLKLRGCDGTEISREPFCVAVSIHHRLAEKKKITLDDLAGENFILILTPVKRFHIIQIKIYDVDFRMIPDHIIS